MAAIPDVSAPIVNLASVFKTQEKLSLEIPKGTGAMVALNVSDGSLKWQRDLPQPAYGAATVSNDLVFTTTFEGKVIAISRDSGSVVWEKQLPAGTNATVVVMTLLPRERNKRKNTFIPYLCHR